MSNVITIKGTIPCRASGWKGVWNALVAAITKSPAYVLRSCEWSAEVVVAEGVVNIGRCSIKVLQDVEDNRIDRLKAENAQLKAVLKFYAESGGREYEKDCGEKALAKWKATE